MTRDEQLHWIALHLVPGLGALRFGELIRRYRAPEAVFRATPSELESRGLPGSVARSIASGCTFDEALKHVDRMLDLGAFLIPLTGAAYPARLKDIYDAPPLLYARGRPELLDAVTIGVVGTRRPTPYGLTATERLAGELAASGVTVASGMARGIDTAAHRAVLAAGGETVAVFGCGIDLVYPSENRKLAQEIATRGLLLSEFPMGTPAHPQNFPIRNRIISGLSLGVLVVEGAPYSGSMITARLAMDQGREVFAVPGNITSKMSWGPNLLIKQGAKLVQDAADILAELSPFDRRRLPVLTPAADGDPGATTLAGPTARIGRAILEALAVDEATHIDTLLEKLPDYSSSEVIAALFELEMAGVVRQLPGRKYLKLWTERVEGGPPQAVNAGV
jgi:DNA processing protein